MSCPKFVANKYIIIYIPIPSSALDFLPFLANLTQFRLLPSPNFLPHF